MQKKWSVLILVGLVSVWANFGYVFAGSLERRDVVRVNNQGSVDVEVVFSTLLQKDVGEELEFEVLLNTHSGDLSALDLSEKVSVNAGDRKVDSANITWEFTSKSAHHPAGILRVRNQAVDGKSLIDGKADVVLEMEDVGGAPSRTFIWEAEIFAGLVSVFSSQYLAYIPNAADGTISVISIPDWQVVNTISVGGEAAHGVAASPDGTEIYVAGSDSRTLYALSPDGLVNREIKIDADLHGVDISKDGEWLFVTGSGKVFAVATDTFEIKGMLDFGEDGASHVDFSPDGAIAYVTNLGGNSVTAIQVPGMKVIERIEVGQGPNESRVSPDGTRAYVANWESHEISVIDTELMTVITNIPVGQGTHGVTVSEDGKYIVTANRLTNDISIIDAQELQVIRSISTGEYANHVAFSPDGLYLFVTNQRDNEVVVLDAAEFNRVATIQVGAEPHEITFAGF